MTSAKSKTNICTGVTQVTIWSRFVAETGAENDASDAAVDTIEMINQKLLSRHYDGGILRAAKRRSSAGRSNWRLKSECDFYPYVPLSNTVEFNG